MSEIIFSSQRVYDGYLAVNSCGKQYLADQDYDTLRFEGRVDFSINYIAKGVGYCETDGKILPIKEGSLVLFFPGVKQHYLFKKDDSAVQMWAHFSGTACGLLESFRSEKSVIVEIKDRKQFESAFEKMILSHYKKLPFSSSVCEGYMTVLLSLLAQSNLQNAETNTRVSNENLEKVLSRMHVDYNKPIDIKEYAGICCVSQDHFIRIFKSYTGLTPYNYQLRIRINRAVEMLENTPISVSQCAETVGFHDNAYFSKVFKRFTGHSPSYYKK